MDPGEILVFLNDKQAFIFLLPSFDLVPLVLPCYVMNKRIITRQTCTQAGQAARQVVFNTAQFDTTG